jgi:cell division protein FtsQ
MTPENRRTGPAAPVSVRAATLDASSPSAVPSGGLFSAMRVIAGVGLVASTSLGLAWALHNHVMKSARFGVTAIEVTGNDRRSAEAIVAESGLTTGTNIFAADLDGARARILADAWVMEASLVRRLPGTILVRIGEHKAAALVVLGETFLASADGEPFKKMDPEDPIDLPLVTGLGPDSLAEDHDGTVRTIARAIDLAAEFGRAELARRAPLQEVHVAPDGTFTLVVGHAAMELVLGGPPFRRKLDQAARVVAELDRRGAKADVVMLDNDARPDRVVVRMR